MQEGCRSCLYGEWLLRKNQGWQDVVELVNCIDPKTKEWSQYAKDNMIDKTPTLLAFDEDLLLLDISHRDLREEYQVLDIFLGLPETSLL